MSDRSVARRYAAALFDVAQKSGLEDRAGRELSGIAQVVTEHAELRSALASPSVPAAAKKNVVTALMSAAGDLTGEVTRVVVMLAERDRLALLPDVAAAYQERLLELRRIVPAEVVTAAPLSEGTRAALAAALGRATGREVTMSERVDPAIVGGVIARVGSVVFDGSVTRQLERLRARLTSGG